MTTRVSHIIGKAHYDSFSSSLMNNCADEEVFISGSIYSKEMPHCLHHVLNDIISVWTESNKFLFSKLTLYNFNVLPQEWKHFSHTGYIMILNLNDIDFTIEQFGDSESYPLEAGGLHIVKTNAMFRIHSKSKLSKLKHLAVFSFDSR